MSNPNKENFQQNVNTRKATPDEVSYRNGYAQGRNSAPKVTYQTPIVREKDDTTNGVLLGILLASLVGIITTATFFILTKQNQPSVVETPLPQSVQPDAAQPQQLQPVQRETTVIERTIDRVQEVVPVIPPDVDRVPVTQPSPALSQAPTSAVDPQPSTQDAQPKTNATSAPGVSNQDIAAP